MVKTLLMYRNDGSTQDCHSYTDINGLENRKKITDKMVRSSIKMKTSTNVNQGKKQNAFCLNNHLVSYVKSTDYILTLKKWDPAQMRHINR